MTFLSTFTSLFRDQKYERNSAFLYLISYRIPESSTQIIKKTIINFIYMTLFSSMFSQMLQTNKIDVYDSSQYCM